MSTIHWLKLTLANIYVEVLGGDVQYAKIVNAEGSPNGPDHQEDNVAHEKDLDVAHEKDHQEDNVPNDFKELCTNKRKLKGNEMVNMGENVSAILQKKLAQKRKDPSMFVIPRRIGNVHIERAMLDLGLSINVMPLSVYSSFDFLEETSVIVQLADRSNVYPVGILEDILVQVDGLIFPADFYVLDMEEDNPFNSSLILLGKPVLKTTKFKIDVHDGTLTMEFDGEIVKFDIFKLP